MREVTSKDGLGAGIIGLGIMKVIYPWASSEMAGDAAFGMLSDCLVASLLTVLCGLGIMTKRLVKRVNGHCSKS